MSNVIVVLFGNNGWDRSAEGAAGTGQRLAQSTGGNLNVVFLGDASKEARDGAAACAASVVVVNQPELAEYQPEAALEAAQKACAEISDTSVVLFGNDTYSQELVPRLAHRLGGCSLADVQGVTADGGQVLATRSAYGGKAMSTYSMKKTPVVLWVRARAMDPATPGAGGSLEEKAYELATPRLTITSRDVLESEGPSLEDASIIVSGGRGLGGPEAFENELKGLATAMHAVQGASRAACDAGWVPPNWQVGQTGKKVAPELYLAIAISGASQHLLGMGDSKMIAAINTDPDAPIFKHCSFGIVEDYKNVVAPLTEKLNSMG